MSARARHRHRSSRSSVGKKVLLAFGVIAAAIGIAAGSAALWVIDIARSAPDIDTLKPADSGATSEIFAADGTRLGFIQADIVREPIELSEMPNKLQRATIAIEDEHFYEHSGVDFTAVLRAGWENITAGEIKQGASTITQQLVRNLYIPDAEDTLERKIIEAEMARQYEEEYSKDEILEEYLNTASYGTNNGRTAVGVEAASQVFFSKPAEELNLPEAALLAGLPQAPSDYNPFLNPEAAKERRNLALQAMNDLGFITDADYNDALAAGLGLERGYRYETIREQYFFDYVQQELIERYGVEDVRQGGLRVYTTIEPKLQEVARTAIAAHPVYGAAAALVSTETETGHILSMASSSSYDDSQFNLAAQGLRQPGSAFKPFVLTAAVDQGLDPDTTYYNGPDTITLDIGYGSTWTVTGGGGTMSVRQATANSINTIYAQLDLDVGPESVTEMAQKMGITAKLNSYPAEALGGLEYGVSVLEMSNAFSTLANGGVHHDPTAILKVEFPDGDVDEPNPNEGERAITDGVAYTVADVMKGTLEYGTAAGLGIGCPASGKTGTTEAQADAWFVGYTPHVSTAVWVGNPDQRVALPGYGAQLAAPIWHDYMLVAATDPCDDFPPPQNPAELTTFFGEYSVSSDFGETTTDTTSTETTTTDETTTDTPPDEYDPDLYAPGAGEDPPPPPDPGGGGTGGGTGGTGA